MIEKPKRKFGKEEPHISNVLRLVEALLLLVEKKLKLDDSQSVKVEWVADNKLLITGEYKQKNRSVDGTTKQALWQLVEKTNTPLVLPQRQCENSSTTNKARQKDVVGTALNYLNELGLWKDERSENQRNTNNTQSKIFTLTLKHKNASLQENLGLVRQKLGLETSPLEEDPDTLPLSFWHECCRKMLPTDLSINPLLHGDGVELTLEDLVPLELVERKQQPQQKEDFSPEHFQVQAPTEYEIPVEHGKFLAHVLETGNNLKNRDRKIAVIGEPGAGKTTLLQEIAKEVEAAGGLAVFVKLADLEEKTLETYLLENWLKEATSKRSVPEDLQDDFVKQFNLGRVWLLLDGVDEIAATGNLLSSIGKQLKGWVADARIVLTCRLNVWDAGKNDLYTFEKYRIQQLSYPNMVDEFIRRFFIKAGEPTKGEKLIEKLERSQPRIRDLVKNPLRLILLCRIWKLREGEQEELPQTKVELYKGFVEKFYEWNDKPEIDEDKRPLLNQALGEMAKNAIDKETTKFRLRKSFVRQELDKFDKSLFDLACRVSWINNVGVAAENPDEPVYAFFHPTFQEYFAALAIDDWRYFLNHVPDNPTQGIYRIFEPQWKEVFLLWLGREEVAKEQKEEFIEALVGFDDGCRRFYWYRTICLIAAGIAEFEECEWADEIVSLLVTGVFGYFDAEEQRWQRCAECMQKAFIAALRETDRSLVIAALSDLLECNLVDRETLCDVAVYLLQISPGNPKAINALSNVLECSSPYNWAGLDFEPIDFPREKAAFWLLENNPDTNNSKAIKILLKPQHMNWDTWERLQANDTNALSKLLEVSRRQYTLDEERDYWEYYLKVIMVGNPDEITTIIQQLRTTPNPNHQDISKLGMIGLDNLDAINYFMELARTYQNNSETENFYEKLLSTLGRIGANDSDVINYLLMLANSGRELERFWAIGALTHSLHGNQLPMIVKGLKRYIQEPIEDNISEPLLSYQYRNISSLCYKIIWRCAERLPYPDFHKAWHSTHLQLPGAGA